MITSESTSLQFIQFIIKMKHLSLLLLGFWSIYVQLFSLFTLSSLCFIPIVSAISSGNETDHLALLKFKKSISRDPYGILLSWNTSTHFCSWPGITCNLKLQRVIQLNLSSYKLEGSIPPHIGNLSYLINFNLASNNIHGKIPQELGRLSRLQQLSVPNNSLVGEIPTNLTGCTDLRFLYINRNTLTGKIPIEIGSLGKLERWSVSVNKLTGEIPPSIGNLSSLTHLGVGTNNFEGHIPQEICRLKNLTFLSFGVNKLTGTFPSCLYNMSSLAMISAPENQLNGSLSPNMFHTLPNLQELYIGNNQISGPIPPSIINASIFFLALDVRQNSLTGQIPSMGKFQYLDLLSLSWNNLGDNSTNDLDFLKTLSNCSQLHLLSISYNNFGGHLPNSLGNLSTQLSQLYLGGNQISGEIPATIGDLIGLTLLTMENNNLGGNIPKTFGKFQKLQKLNLGANKLSGELRAYIGNLTQLFHLELEDNLFEGNIPPSIGNCQNLQYLDLSDNNLTGTIPLDLFKLSSLTNLLNLSLNSLSGSIPEEVGSLINLGWLDMSENHMSGEIPPTMGECIMLEYLYLQGNSLQGIIPSSLGSIKGLQRLDLSRNGLSGSIPNVLENISLKYFNLSFNKLEGEVPTKGIFGSASGILVMGNNKLCGGTSELHLPPCPVKGKKHAKHHKFRLIAVIVSVIAFFLILSIILTIYWTRKRSKKTSLDSPTIDQLATVSYQSLHKGTDGFLATNLIGSGNFSSVYKGTLEELKDKVVAIKVLDLQKKGAHKSFIAECNALRNIKHRNLVQILTCCSSIDYKGQEFKALIFQYMTNGSLEQWLHPKTLSTEHPRILSLDQRLNIMVDVASALHYLHHECEQSIIHCDLKPSNVLLDNEMVAHVSDFGIAKLLSTINDTISKQTSTTIGIKGTIGYVPPEYGVSSEVSTCGDIYSFGILMLEMLTGRSPTDEMFEDGQNLRNFVITLFPDNLLQILDPRLIPSDEAPISRGNNWNLDPNVEMCLVSLFRIGLSCTRESPKDRMDIADVTRELNRISETFLGGVETSK